MKSANSRVPNHSNSRTSSFSENLISRSKSTMPLQEAFEEFRNGKEALQRIHNDAVNCFGRILERLSSPKDEEIRTELSSISRSPQASPNAEDDVARAMADVQLSFDLGADLYTQDEKAEIERLFVQEPALIVVGQTNCGKSSIINEFLGTKALPTSDRPCTARIVRVTYSEEPFMKLQARDGRVLEDVKGKSRIPRKMIELQQEDRGNTDMVSASLVAGLNIDFLKAGVDIIDSPGKNENKELDNLVNEQLKNMLPVIIYVVDGHNLFTSQVRCSHLFL